MNTEASHGHGDDMTHDNSHDHTCPDTRQYNLLAPETEVISDWQRSKLLPHPPHSSQRAKSAERPIRGQGQDAGPIRGKKLQQETSGRWPSYPGVITSSIHKRYNTTDTSHKRARGRTLSVHSGAMIRRIGGEPQPAIMMYQGDEILTSLHPLLRTLRHASCFTKLFSVTRH